MSANPEQSVIDAINGLEDDEIGELVRWQIEEGIRRGEYPVQSEDPWARRMDTSRFWQEMERMGFRAAAASDSQFSQRYHLPADISTPSSVAPFQIGWGGSSSSP